MTCRALRRGLVMLVAAIPALRSLAAQQAVPPTAHDLAAAETLLRQLLATDPANGEALYEAQQRGMSAAEAVFRLGSGESRHAVLRDAAALLTRLPTLDTLLSVDALSRHIGAVERWSPLLTRLRQRFARLAVSVDGVAVPGGAARQCRVFPLAGDEATITVGSEVQLQFLFLVSTIERLAAASPHLAADAAPLGIMDAALLAQVRCFWSDLPAWHWSGPFPNLRARLLAKLEERDDRVRVAPWYAAMIDHDLFLMAIAADLFAARHAMPSLWNRTTASDRRMLEEIRRLTREAVTRRVAPDARARHFLLDVGRWSSNPSYAYAGCTTSRPVPDIPCPVRDVAPDASHARRWPWWLDTFAASWPARSAAAVEYQTLKTRLARQMTDVVIYRSPDGRPLLRNYMDGRDGWYRLREFPNHPWGHGPSTMSGTLRYGSWARLSVAAAPLRGIHRDFCRIITSTAAEDIAFRTRWYGSATTEPDSGGVGVVDLYGAESPFALTCRLDAALGHH